MSENELNDGQLQNYLKMSALSLEQAKAIERVRKLHRPFGDEFQWCNHCEIGQVSGYDWADYPCDTIKALDGDVDV